MRISAHDVHNKVGGPGQSAVSAATPAWELGWSAQNNVSAAIVTATGGTYTVSKPEAEEVAAEEPKKTVRSKKS